MGNGRRLVGESLATMRSGGEKSKRMICGSEEGVAHMVVIALLYLCQESLKKQIEGIAGGYSGTTTN
jgi:hypothetical protein